jgi:uncharacterized protein (TIRG00374 family)
LRTVGKYWRVLLLGGLVSAAAIYLVFHQIDLRALGLALAGADYIYIVPSALLIVIGLGARTVRWRVLLAARLPTGRAFNIINITYLLNGLLPFRLGELGRAYLATRAQPPVPAFTTLSTILVERLLDTLAVLVIIGVALPIAPVPPELRAAAFAFLPALLIGFTVVLVLAAHPARTLGLARRLLPASFPPRERILGWLEHFLSGLRPLTRPRTLALLLFWTAAAWALSVLSGFVLMRAFFPSGDLGTTALFTAAASFAVALPAVPGNVGPYEASILIALSAMGYGADAETALAFAIVVHFLNLGVVAILGVSGFIAEGVSLEQLSQGVRSVRQQESAAG